MFKLVTSTTTYLNLRHLSQREVHLNGIQKLHKIEILPDSQKTPKIEKVGFLKMKLKLLLLNGF